MFKKGLVVIAVPFVVQLVFIAALWRSQKESSTAQAWAIHTKSVIAQAETAARYLTEAENSVRGLIVSGDEGLSRTYQASASRAPHELKRFRKLVFDHPDQELRVRSIEKKALAFLAGLAETHRLAMSGRTHEAAARVRASVSDGATSEIRHELDRFLAEEDRLDRLRLAHLDASLDRQAWAIAAGAVALVAVALVMVLAFSRGFSRRVSILAENARRLAQGKPLAAPVGGRDEISELDMVFHAMAKSLAEKDQENEMFIYSVSHDLRSPLVNLQGFSRELSLTSDDLRVAVAQADVPESTRRRVEMLLDRDMSPSIHFIQNAVTRLSSIIDSLLRLSRAGRVVLRWQEVDVSATVGRVVEALRGSIAERGAEVVVGDLPPVWGDVAAVEQVFANLIGNAVNYLDPARPGRIEVGVLPDDGPDRNPDQRTFFVKDNGLGVPAAYQPKLFEAFKRLHPTMSPGEGIGLALVRRMAERHGGKVWVESNEGQGSTFFVTLPASQPEGGAGNRSGPPTVQAFETAGAGASFASP